MFYPSYDDRWKVRRRKKKKKEERKKEECAVIEVSLKPKNAKISQNNPNFKNHSIKKKIITLN